MKSIFLIAREITIDGDTFMDIEDVCFSNGEDAMLALEAFNTNSDSFIYSIKIINLVN